MKPPSILFLLLVSASVCVNGRAAMLYNANFNSYSAGSSVTVNATGNNNTFSNVSDAGTNGVLTVAAAALPDYASNYLTLTRTSGSQANFNIAQQDIASLSLTGSTFVFSLDLNRGATGASNPTLSMVTSGGAAITNSGILLNNPSPGNGVVRVTYVYNGTGSNILLPGSLGNLASGSAAAYSYNGSTFSLQSTVAITGTQTIGGFNIRVNLSSGRVNNFDNLGVWNSASDTFNGTNVLALAPGTVVPEPSTYALLGLALVSFGVRRLAGKKRAPQSRPRNAKRPFGRGR